MGALSDGQAAVLRLELLGEVQVAVTVERGPGGEAVVLTLTDVTAQTEVRASFDRLTWAVLVRALGSAVPSAAATLDDSGAERAAPKGRLLGPGDD